MATDVKKPLAVRLFFVRLFCLLETLVQPPPPPQPSPGSKKPPIQIELKGNVGFDSLPQQYVKKAMENG